MRWALRFARALSVAALFFVSFFSSAWASMSVFAVAIAFWNACVSVKESHPFLIVTTVWRV